MRKLLTKILSVIVAVTATLGLVMLPKTAVQASEFTFGAVAGASVKFGDTIEETGLRFTIEVDKEFYASLGDVEFGALLTTKKYADANGVSLDDNSGMVANVAYVNNATKFDAEADSENFVYYASVTYLFNEEWKNEVVNQFASTGLSEDEIFNAAKLSALATELVCKPYYIANGEVVYAELSDARSMLKVANATVIDGEAVTSDFVAKYLSSVVESDSEVLVDAKGTVLGLSAADKEFIASATTYTADGSASNIAFPIVDDVMNGDFLAGKEIGNYYYVTAFKGAQALRIKYLYVTMFIDEAEDLDVFRYDYANTGVVPTFDGYYIVTKDIDASSYVMADHKFASGVVYPNSEDKKGGLTGTFDGNGHVISNITTKNNGIFAWINAGATIKNVAFTNVTLTGANYPSLFSHGLESKNANPTTMSNIYVSVKSMQIASGVLVNNGPSIHGTKYNNVVIEWTNYGEAESAWLYKNGRFGTLTDFTVNAGVYNGMFNEVYTITSSPVFALRTSAGAIDKITVAGNLVTKVVAEDESVSYTTDNADLQALLDNYNYSLLSENVQKDVKSYASYAAMAQDSEANAEALETFNSKYWTVVNGVPYWKSLYSSMVDVVITDKDGNVVDPSEIVLQDNTTTYAVELLDDTHKLADFTITGDGLAVNGNKFKLESKPAGEGTIEVTVVAIVNGVEVNRTFVIAYSNQVAVDGKVLYSQADKALDLPSLKAALAEAGKVISDLSEIDGYVVNGETVSVLDLEVIVSNHTSANYGRNRKVDVAQEVKVAIDGNVYTLANVYAYTKIIDEAEDLKFFTMKGATEANPHNETADGYVIVTKDIDASNLVLADHVFMSAAVYPGNGYNADVGFRGVLDGQGHVIDGLTTKSCGLFGQSNAAIVKNIAFTNANLTGYYATLLTQNNIRGKDYANGFNGYEGEFSNVYISIASITTGGSKRVGVLVNQTMPATSLVQNVIIEYANVSEAVQAQINAKNNFYMFGSSGNAMTSSLITFKDCYAISTAPTLSHATQPGFGENQVEYTLSADGRSIASVGAVLDPSVTEILTLRGVTLNVGHVLVGLRAYDNYEAMAADSNDLTSFDSAYWVVKNGIAYWKNVYLANFKTEVKQGDKVIDEILLKDSKTEIALNILDMSGNAVESTITAPEGITVNGNLIKLASEPTGVGSYEVKIEAVVEGMTIERYITINYSNAYDVAGKVLYSQVDKSLDVDSLNAALNAVGAESVNLEDIDGYVVGGEDAEELELDVIITGATQKRTVDTAQSVVVKVAGKVYNLTNVYAYTKLIDDLADLDWLTRQKETLADETVLYDVYDGVYLMTKNIDGAGLGENGENYQLMGTLTSAASKDVGLTGVFDGQGYTISNVSLPSRGLFTFIKGGVVKNLGFVGCEINGYYPVVLTHAITNYDVDGNGTKDIPLIKNIYVEGTIVELNYTQSGRESAILAQNNFYTYAENVVVKHTMSDAQKEAISTKRFGIFHTQYYHTKDITNNKGMNAFYKDFYVISDAPLAFGTHASSTTWSHFLLALNTVQVNAETNKWELKDAVKFAFIESLLTRTYTIGGVEYTWDTSAAVITDKVMAIDVVSTMYHYVTASDMAAAGNDYSTFDKAYWTIVDGIPMWTTAI